MLWLYLHFPHLLLDHIRRSRADVGALVIIENSGQIVLQACPKARDYGVYAGMRLKTAINLVPELGIVRSDHQQEARVLEEQARWLYRYAAHIILVAPDGLLAEVSSLQRLYGGLSAVWQAVKQALGEHQLTAWPGFGYTPLAARLIARTGKGECTSDKGRLFCALGQISLPDAEFDARTCTRLQRLGLNTLKEVFDLPAAELARRLSPETLSYVQKIQGTRADPRLPWQPPHYFRQQVDFIPEVEKSQGLLFPLQRILSELEQDLCWRQQSTDSLLLVLSHRNQEPTRLRIRSSGPEHRAHLFLDLISLRFEQHILQAPVTSLALTVRRFLEREPSAGRDLLGGHQDPDEAWHTLISRLQSRLGESAVQQLSPQADHRPEKAWSAFQVQGKSQPTTVSGQLSLRPMWLLKGPQPLLEPPKAWFTGPERISGGWWDGHRVQRDYYIAQLNSGQLAWVFRDVRDGWFIHGWFG
ncbi:MAG TPA: DNA polymerase Y family protein [Marinobacter sp.]|nr:DNA polymerase Y family protein [Marinobacter sp.]